MTELTKTALSAILAGDPTIPNDAKKSALEILHGDVAKAPPIEKPVTYEEAAERLGVSTWTVKALARSGRLVRVFTGAAAKKSRGVTAASLAALASGNATAGHYAPPRRATRRPGDDDRKATAKATK